MSGFMVILLIFSRFKCCSNKSSGWRTQATIMTTEQGSSNSAFDSNGPGPGNSWSQHDGALQLPSSISFDERRKCMTEDYLESRHSAPEVHIPHSAAEVHIAVKDWNSSLALGLTLSQSERKPAYLLNRETSRPALSASPSPERMLSRFSARNFTDLSENRLQTEARAEFDQTRAANNQASYNKFRTRSARFDR